MLFPNIDYCLVCEGIRPEPGGKLTILGFYAPIPFVDVGLESQDEVIASFTFLLGFGKVSGEFAVNTSILGPDKSIVVEDSLGTLYFKEGYSRTHLVCTFPPFSFQQEGKQVFQLIIDNQIKYKATFSVKVTR